MLVTTTPLTHRVGRKLKNAKIAFAPHFSRQNPKICLADNPKDLLPHFLPSDILWPLPIIHHNNSQLSGKRSAYWNLTIEE